MKGTMTFIAGFCFVFAIIFLIKFFNYGVQLDGIDFMLNGNPRSWVTSRAPKMVKEKTIVYLTLTILALLFSLTASCFSQLLKE